MLDWLASKVAMTVAAMVLLASAAGFFAWQHAETARRSLDGTAENIARFLDTVSSLHGEASFTISFAPGASFVLSGGAGGYEVEIHRRDVLVMRGGTVAFAPLGFPVHLFRPDRPSYAGTEIAALDAAHAGIRLPTDRSLEVLRLAIAIDGQEMFATFVALPQP